MRMARDFTGNMAIICFVSCRTRGRRRRVKSRKDLYQLRCRVPKSALRLGVTSADQGYPPCDGARLPEPPKRCLGHPVRSLAAVSGAGSRIEYAIQYNSSGTFGASANLTWSGTALVVTGDINCSGLLKNTHERTEGKPPEGYSRDHGRRSRLTFTRLKDSLPR